MILKPKNCHQSREIKGACPTENGPNLNGSRTSTVSAFFHDLAPERENPRLSFGILGLTDLTVLHVHLRESSPRKEIVGLECSSLQTGTDRLFEMSGFHQGHSKSVPAVKKSGVLLYAETILLDRRLQIANGELTVGIVEEVVEFNTHCNVVGATERSEADSMRR